MVGSRATYLDNTLYSYNNMYASSYGDAWSTLETLAPSIDRLTSTYLDPRQRLANLQAKLAAARAQGASLQTLQELEAKIEAVKLQIAKEDEGTVSTQQTRFLVQLGIGSVALIALATAFFILTRAFRR